MNSKSNIHRGILAYLAVMLGIGYFSIHWMLTHKAQTESIIAQSLNICSYISAITFSVYMGAKIARQKTLAAVCMIVAAVLCLFYIIEIETIYTLYLALDNGPMIGFVLIGIVFVWESSSSYSVMRKNS